MIQEPVFPFLPHQIQQGKSRHLKLTREEVLAASQRTPFMNKTVTPKATNLTDEENDYYVESKSVSVGESKSSINAARNYILDMESKEVRKVLKQLIGSNFKITLKI
ncbi:hypothetical protein BC938DRAFT_484150 [Jimgerdemannia flammicorona]|uniref:Uncharacterized protein n=1 Tax=Jimgerdemannia flammicorona TaxID=994334 RepID=A0A433QAG7_9FUNG|nr:hypothetical protein BC938DRAFT_484150 [Jimgerdemannia flammicorona]